MKISTHNLLTYSILLLISLLCSGCQTTKINGQFIDDEAIKEIENKKLTKAEIVHLIGSPTVVPDYSPNNWYYIQRTVVTRAWFEPKISEQKITEVSFDHNDRLSKIMVYNNMNVEDIIAAKEYTNTNGTEANIIQKFIRNIGRFNKPTNDKNRKAK